MVNFNLIGSQHKALLKLVITIVRNVDHTHRLAFPAYLGNCNQINAQYRASIVGAKINGREELASDYLLLYGWLGG
jgi:hypothetical protein